MAVKAKKRGLGRGLDALLGVSPGSLESDAEVSGDSLHKLPVDLIERGKYQPRVDMHNESLEDLAASIRAQGVVQPIVVRPLAGGRYEIIAGERRWRATQLAGLHEIPALVRDVPDREAISMALIENIQREDLNPIEEANALARLLQEFEMTHQEAADAVGRSRAAVSNLLRLLELEPGVKELLSGGGLEMGHARALLGLKGHEQVQAGKHVAARGLSVRETERLVRKMLDSGSKKAGKPRPVDPNIRQLVDRLSQTLAAQVEISHQAKGKGKLVIHYNSMDELDGILEHIA